MSLGREVPPYKVMKLTGASWRPRGHECSGRRVAIRRPAPQLFASVRTREGRITVLRQLLAILLVFALVSCAKRPAQLLVGEWEGTDHKGETAALIFYADGTARFLQGNLVMDGSSVGGKVTWRLNESQNPMHLDLIITTTAGQPKILPLIIRFVTEQKIQIKMSADMQSRPIRFSEDDNINQIVLIKQ